MTCDLGLAGGGGLTIQKKEFLVPIGNSLRVFIINKICWGTIKNRRKWNKKMIFFWYNKISLILRTLFYFVFIIIIRVFSTWKHQIPQYPTCKLQIQKISQMTYPSFFWLFSPSILRIRGYNNWIILKICEIILWNYEIVLQVSRKMDCRNWKAVDQWKRKPMKKERENPIKFRHPPAMVTSTNFSLIRRIEEEWEEEGGARDAL